MALREDFLGTYHPPGIYSNPIKGPQLAINSSLPTAVGLVGTARGYEIHTEGFQFNDSPGSNPIPHVLDKTGIIRGSIVLRNQDTQEVIAAEIVVNGTGGTTTNEANYTVTSISGSNGRFTITRSASTTIASDQAVQVTYSYAEPGYFQPQPFYDYRDVVAMYGEPLAWDEQTKTPQILSEISLAAKFAILNGAHTVVCVPVIPTGGTGTQPRTVTTDDYNTAIDLLKDNSDVAVIVPLNGIASAAHVKQHVNDQSQTRYERRAILGFDGATTPISTTTRSNSAGTENTGLDARIMMVSPSQFKYYAAELDKYGNNGKEITLGGQYMAASLAGMTVSMSPAQPLTHKFPVGWKSLSDSDVLNEGQMTRETTEGLCVIEYDRRKSIRVRHGVSTNPSNLLDREWSIIGQQDALVYRLRDYLDDANLIGQPIYSYTLVNVKASAEAALQSLVRDSLLVDYVGLSARQLLQNPDVIEISFGWRPAFPLNYIILTFAVNLTTGTLGVNSGTANRSSFTSTTQTTVTPMASANNNFGGTGNTLNSV
jgi:hypothetical protein